MPKTAAISCTNMTAQRKATHIPEEMLLLLLLLLVLLLLLLLLLLLTMRMRMRMRMRSINGVTHNNGINAQARKYWQRSSTILMLHSLCFS